MLNYRATGRRRDKKPVDNKLEWDDPEFLTLRKYGASIADATGRLKNFQEITEEVYQAYKKAKAAGEEIEFLQLTGGESGIRDAIQYFERYEEALEDAAKIFDAGLDPDEFHKADRALKLLTEQMGEFKDAAENLVTPFSVDAMKKLFEVFHSGTEFLVENKDAIQSWGYVAAETFSTVADKASALKSALSSLSDFQLSFDDKAATEQFNNFLDKAKNDIENTPWEKILKSAIQSAAKDSYGLYSLFGGIFDRAAAKQEEDQLKLRQQKALKTHENLNREFAKRRAAAKGEPTTQYGWQRFIDLKDEVEELNIEIEHFKHGYDAALEKLELERARAYRQNDLSLMERLAIEDNYLTKREQLNQETEDKLSDLRDEATAEFKTDLANRMIEIENLKDDWIDAGMEEAEAEKYAQALKAKAIEDLNDEIADKLDSIYQDSLEKRLNEIEREKQAWIDKGVEEVKATKWAEQAKVDAQREAALSILRSQAEELHAFNEGGYEGLKDYYRDQLEKSGVDPADFAMTPQQLADFQKAAQIVQRSLLPNFMTDTDRAMEDTQTLKSFIVEQERRRAEAEKFAAGVTKDGVPTDPHDLYDLFGVIPDEQLEEFKQKLESASDSVESFQLQLEKSAENETPAQPETAPENPTAPSDFDTGNISAAFDLLSPTLENLSSEFDNLTPAIENVSNYFGGLAENVLSVTEVFASLAEKISNLEFPANSTPTEITNNVTISEAHAWDYSHIQELAEKVAEVITPRILGAIGGDSNSY